MSKCPACERNVSPWQTKIADTPSLCQKHSDELNGQLKAVMEKYDDEGNPIQSEKELE